MREIKRKQLQIGEKSISEIKFDMRSRDEIPKLLMGLQKIYCTPEIREKIFKILKEIIPEKTKVTTGRPGMELWKILVIGTIRLNCNWDYDKLLEMLNNHNTLRQMLGHGAWDFEYKYKLQTIKDNVSLLTEEILNKINEEVVKYGQKLMLKKTEKIKGRCDSFVVEIAIQFPTDINLLYKSIKKIIELISRQCQKYGISGWRKMKKIIKKLKQLFRNAQQIKRTKSKKEEIIAYKEKRIHEVYKNYINEVLKYLIRAKENIKKLNENHHPEKSKILEIEKYIEHAERQIEQIERRVLNGEKILHSEKKFSIFKDYVEWICKGKVGINQELGLLVCIMTDQKGFILNHKVMEKIKDKDICVPITKETKQKFQNLISCSYDKGFYTPENKENLKEILDTVILPKKGKSASEEKTEEFKQLKRKHSAVESSINALENHGLDRCMDYGIVGFKRYVALSVVARNIQILGNHIQQQQIKSEKRRKKYNATLNRNRLLNAA